MADGEEYYVEETAEYAEETAEYAEETGEDAPAGEVDVVGRLLCKHHDNLTARQYYVSFGIGGLVMFCYMLLLLIAVGHWTVSASPLVIQEQFSSLSVIPVAIVFSIMFFCSIGAWGCAFMGFGLNYFELPAGPTYSFWALLSNVLCVVLFIFCIIYWAILPLSHDVINDAFTDYSWTYVASRNQLKRLPDGGQCDVTGSMAELMAKKPDCADRTYQYLKTWTIVTSVLGMICAVITILAILFPIPPKFKSTSQKSMKSVDGEDKEA